VPERGGLQISEALELYRRSGRVSRAIRIARTNDLSTDMLALALIAEPAQMLEAARCVRRRCVRDVAAHAAARYFEGRGEVDKAVQLYSRGGDVNSAVDLCFAAGLYDALADIGTPPLPLSFLRCPHH
jgi:hypothetical protein